MGKQDVLQAIEGFYLSGVLVHFSEKGLFDELISGRTPAEIARSRHYDERLFLALLDFISEKSDVLIRKRNGRYEVRPKYLQYYSLGFQLAKFIGAYGPTVLQMEESLTRPQLGRDLVRRAVEAEAYRIIESPPNPLVLEIARERGIGSLLDLGCGPGTLLSELSEGNSDFRGWGLDASPEMCAVARRRISEKNLSRRVRILCGDVRRLATHVPSRTRSRIEYLHAKGLLDELFRSGDAEAIKLLANLRRLFPGRLLLVVDYYGKLTRVRNSPARFRHTIIHDVIQVLTAQGVPPEDVIGWARLYDAAGCSLDHAYEAESQGIDWFVHIVRLNGTKWRRS
ncbi:MAG: methyltransferase domain-containing protein [Acidobacteriota bacterium]